MLHSHYSVLSSTLRPEQLVQFCKEQNQSLCLTDTNSVSGCISTLKLCQKNNVKPILGAEILTNIGYLTLIAKNTQGWKELVGIISLVESGNNDITSIVCRQNQNLIAITGYEKSTLQHYLFKDGGPNSEALDNARGHFDLLSIYFQHVYCGLDDINDECKFLRTCLDDRLIIDWRPRFFTEGSRANFGLVTKLGNHTNRSYKTGLLDDSYYVPSCIVSQIEDYNLFSKPKLPKFSNNENALLRQLCRNGWVRLELGKLAKNEQDVYVERINYELTVIEQAGLEGYFLTVHDYIWWAKNNGIMVGPGRGSSAGCLISYLLGITNINPIKYNLSFSRFYCSGRNTKDNISLPDIDSDFPVGRREEVIDYITNKYGADKVSHISTFGRLQGRGALKEVLKHYGAFTNGQINSITENIPDASKISDKLEEENEESILRWVLRNEPDILKDYCYFDESGEKLDGPCAVYFAQAIQLEGIIRNRSKHASGLIISNDVIGEICPVADNTALIEMSEAEMVGLCKFDILGLSCLDKIDHALKLIKGRHYVKT